MIFINNWLKNCYAEQLKLTIVDDSDSYLGSGIGSRSPYLTSYKYELNTMDLPASPLGSSKKSQSCLGLQKSKNRPMRIKS